MKTKIEKAKKISDIKLTLTKTIKIYEILKQSFGTSTSQWMESNMALSAQTPLRNIRHLLARIERSYQACKDTEYKLKKQYIKKEMKKRDLKKEKEEYKKKIIDIEIDEIENRIDSALYYFRGAVKKIQYNYDCIRQIMESKGYNGINEIDFEREEEEYHIKTAINQSIRVIRMTGGIDQGNQEYLEQCGINPAIVQNMIREYLNIEQEAYNQGKGDKTTKSLYNFINHCYQEFKGQSEKRLVYLGVKTPFMESVMYEISNKHEKLLKGN